MSDERRKDRHRTHCGTNAPKSDRTSGMIHSLSMLCFQGCFFPDDLSATDSSVGVP
jgi:hypothetical protein